MRKVNEIRQEAELLDEYDFSNLKGVRGKHAGHPANHRFTIEITRKEDGRWLASISAFGVEALGETREEAISKAQGRAFRVLADRIEQGKMVLGPSTLSFSVSEQ